MKKGRNCLYAVPAFLLLYLYGTILGDTRPEIWKDFLYYLPFLLCLSCNCLFYMLNRIKTML